MSDEEGAPAPRIIIQEKRIGSGAGLGSIICGILGIFFYGIVFVPLGLIMGVVAIAKGQVAFGIIGIVLAVIGFFTSPTIWALFGMGALITIWQY